MKTNIHFLTISRSVLLRMRNISDKRCKDNQNTNFVCSFFSRAVDSIMWKNTAQPDRLQMTIWRMRTACWIRRTTYIHLGFVVIIPFPLQQRLHERSLKLRNTYIVCLVCNGICEKLNPQINSDLIILHITTGTEFRHQVKSTTWKHRRLKLLEKGIILDVFLTVRWTYTDLLQTTHPSHEITTKGVYFVIVNNSAVPQLRLLFARFHFSTIHVGFMLGRATQTPVSF